MRKSKSYFPQILRDFLLTLIVPILAFVFLYLQAESIVKEQTLSSNKKTLNQFFELIDTTLYEMKMTGRSIADNKLCEEYASFAKSGNKNFTYNIQKIIDMLNEHSREKYEDFFVYYAGNDRIISGYKGSMNVEDYRSIYYASGVAEEFYNVLNCEKKQATLYTIKGDEEKPLLCVAMRKAFSGNSTKDYVVVQIISPSYLNKIMTEKYFSEEGTLLIFNKDKELLLSGDGRMDYHLNDYMNSNEPYETLIGEESYIMQAWESESIKGYYAYATPARYFWRTLSNMRLICILSGIACTFVSVLIAYCGSKRTYSPLWNVVNRIEAHNMLHYDSDQSSELEFIEKILEKNISEKKYLSKKSEHAKQERFVTSLLQGHVEGVSYGENDFIQHGIELCSDRFRVAIISINESPEIDIDLQGFIIKNVFEELCNRKHKGYVVSNIDNQYAVLVNLREGVADDDEIEMWREGQIFLKEHFRMTVTIALGEMCEGMKEIQNSYKEAQSALHYKYLLGEGNCICYSVIKERKFSYLVSTESKLSKMVIGYMKDSAPAKTPEIFVNELLDVYGIHENAAMDTVECFKYEVMSVLNKAILSNSGMIDNRKHLIEELILQPSLEMFQKKLTKILGMLWEKEQQSSEQEDICKRVKVYILEHFRDSHLSVAMLGEEMKVSASYLSKLFKEKYDISIPDFISQTRVKSAKDDLKNTNKNIKQVAEENGFLSSTVFINTFKKWEGVTPGIYRNLE